MLSLLQLVAQTTYTYTTTSTKTSGNISPVFLLFVLAIILISTISMVKVFMKADRKWWEAIIPIYSNYVLLKIVGRPDWWLLLFFIPFVNIVVSFIVSADLAKAFGKGVGTAVLLILFPYIMFPVFAFGESYKYVGPGGSPANPSQSPQPPTPGPTPTAPPVTPPEVTAPPSNPIG